MSECKTETTEQVPCPYCGRRPYMEYPIAGTIVALIGLAIGVTVALLPSTLVFIHESNQVFKGSAHGWEGLSMTGIMAGFLLAGVAVFCFVIAGYCFFGPPDSKKAP